MLAYLFGLVWSCRQYDAADGSGRRTSLKVLSGEDYVSVTVKGEVQYEQYDRVCVLGDVRRNEKGWYVTEAKVSLANKAVEDAIAKAMAIDGEVEERSSAKTEVKK